MKREREKARVEKRNQKAAKRSEKAQRGPDRPDGGDGVDPDIAHIQLGPQPPEPWQVDEYERLAQNLPHLVEELRSRKRLLQKIAAHVWRALIRQRRFGIA